MAAHHAVSRCARCGFRFLNPRPGQADYEWMYRSHSGPLAEDYPPIQGYYAQEDEVRLAEYRSKLDHLIALGARGRLLEIGACGGVFLHEATRRGFDVEGIEPGEENRLRALNRYGLRLRAGRAEDQELPENSFDVVFSSHAFEHLLDPMAVTQLAFRWLRPGGLLVIEVPNQFESFAARRKRWLKTIRRRDRSFLSVHHTAFFSPRTLRLLVERAGFRPRRPRNVYYTSDSAWGQPLRTAGRVIGAAAGGSGAIEIVAQKPDDTRARFESGEDR